MFINPVYAYRFFAAWLLFLCAGVVQAEGDKKDKEKETAARGSGKQEKVLDVQVLKMLGTIMLDGQLDEVEWQGAEMMGDFIQQMPNEGLPASQPTEVYVKYDEDFMYVGAVLYTGNQSGDYVITSLRRDFNFDENDAFAILLGPYDDGTNGFIFAVNPYNVQMEGLINNGERVSQVWDNKWYSAVTRYDDRWEVEMAIPFKTLRYSEGSTYWKANFIRNDRKTFERSTWAPVPVNQRYTSLAFTGDLNWEQPLKKPGTNIAVIPYLAANTSRDFRTEQAYSGGMDAGFDAKIALSPSMNLDLTFNPDFSTVEVDQQQTNLNRFELFFPERRQFFLENEDLFGDFGFRQIRPFFSRRIGIATDSIGRSTNNRILYGARLNGNLGDNTRLGVMNMQTAEEEGIGFPGQNFTVASVQRKVFSRSNIGAIFVNRMNTTSPELDQSNPRPAFNRVVGLDYNLASKDNKWTGKFFYHQSFSPDQQGDARAHGSYLGYNTKNWTIHWNHEYVGEGFNAETGFVPRRGYWRLEPFVRYRILHGQSSKIFQQTLQVMYDLYTDDAFGQKTDEKVSFVYRLYFKNTSNFQARVFNEYVYLFAPFDPTRTGGERLATGSDFRFTRYGATYTSDRRALFNYSLSAYNGGFFNGTRTYFNAFLNYRFQPYGNVSMAAEHNILRFPAPYNNADLWLIGPRVELAFTDKVFLSTFVQYNNQIDNVNVNTRFQWRFKPVSDLFIVYTDNYSPENMLVKNRALILKLTYWLNV
ncbi:MAG: DUF5916 domain-containing protein [Nitritalea sp.]